MSLLALEVSFILEDTPHILKRKAFFPCSGILPLHVPRASQIAASGKDPLAWLAVSKSNGWNRIELY